MAKSLKERHAARLADLKKIRSAHEDDWREIAENLKPSRLRLTAGYARGKHDRKKIIDSTGPFAIRTLASGMHSGITSPSRPWFRLTTEDPELKEFQPVKVYIQAIERIMRAAFARTNFYNAQHTGYADLGLFGQKAGLILENPEFAFSVAQKVHGEFWLACDALGRATTLISRIPMTVEQMVNQFGRSVSPTVMSLYDRGNYDDWINDVYHIVAPRRDREPGKIDAKNKPFQSCYWDEGDSRQDHMLREGGFDENPILAPRWETTSTDIYASTCPGVEMLPDVKMLNREQMWKGEGIERNVRPTMQGPTSLQTSVRTNMPGGVVFVDDSTGQGLRPVHVPTVNLSDLRQDIAETQERVRQAAFADLFLMLANMEGIQPRNQFEIAERKEEKLLALGPVLDKLYIEDIKVAIDRVYGILERAGAFPEPPEELDNVELQIEMISILYQAQKAVATGAIERTAAFVGTLAAAKPEVLDKFDADQAVDEFADGVGAPPSVIVSDDRVEQIRQQRAEEQRQRQQAEMAATMAPAAKAGAEAASVLADAAQNGAPNILRSIGL